MMKMYFRRGICLAALSERHLCIETEVENKPAPRISWLRRGKILIKCKVGGLIPQIYLKSSAQDLCRIYLLFIFPHIYSSKG